MDDDLLNGLNDGLLDYDNANYKERLFRYWKLSKIQPNEFLIMGMSETVILFNEIKETYVNGQLLATLILIQTCIEKLFYNHLKNLNPELNLKSLNEMIQYSRNNELFNSDFLGLIDKLRKIRNPLVHQNKVEFDKSIAKRCYKNCRPVYAQLEEEADEALILLFTIIKEKIFILDNGIEFIDFQ